MNSVKQMTVKYLMQVLQQALDAGVSENAWVFAQEDGGSMLLSRADFTLPDADTGSLSDNHDGQVNLWFE
jgi:hypothetical protein